VYIFKEFQKGATTLEPLGYNSQYGYIKLSKNQHNWNLCVRLNEIHAHLNPIGIMCSKFYLDDLRTVEEFRETDFYQQNV